MSIKGIDVSKHQGKIDWKKVKESGQADFAIIRSGYGYTYQDPNFEQNIKGAVENGIKVGIYWFIYALNVEEAVKNADKCHSIIAPYIKDIKMKVWCDFEYDSDTYAQKNGVTFTKEDRTGMVKAFCERMKELGYEVGVYANRDYLKNKFNDVSEYPLWYALYNTEKDRVCLAWQYSSKGSVAGINGNVDMNVWYGETEATEGDKSVEDYAKEVIDGKHGNGHENREASLKAIGCPYEYEEVRAKVNELLSISADSDYYNRYKGSSTKIDVVFKAIGVPSEYIGSWAKRKAVANANGIKFYIGSNKQNLELIELAMLGKLKRV